MKIIANVNKDWAIGKDGRLLISIPEDMRFFYEQTVGGVVIMGRKTLDSFPGRRPLKGRINLVLTRDASRIGKESIETCDKYYDFTGEDFNEDNESLKDAVTDILVTAAKNLRLGCNGGSSDSMETYLLAFYTKEAILKLTSAVEKNLPKARVFVIGGESIYREFLGDVAKCLLTKNDCDLKGDSFFPDLSKIPGWTLSKKGELKKYKDIHFSFDTWRKD